MILYITTIIPLFFYINLIISISINFLFLLLKYMRGDILQNFHGANLFEIAQKNHVDINEIMDFSSNINPLSPSPRALKFLKENLDLIRTYPDPSYNNLKNSISSYVHCHKDHIILGLGATELLINFINIIDPKKSLILSPSYSEYENNLRNIGSQIYYYQLNFDNNFKISCDYIIDFINKNNIELFVFSNPNNPTGSILTNTEIKKILNKTKAYIIVDETYIEFTDMDIYSCTNLISSFDRLIVTRGTSKFFGIPGLRLGYSLNSNVEIIEKFKKNQVLWQINICADIMGQEMFKDKEYIERVFKYITDQRLKLTDEIKKINNLMPIESKGNFILVKVLKGTNKIIVEKLKKDLIFVRDCSNFKGLDDTYFRFCILDTKSNEIFIKKLKDIKL